MARGFGWQGSRRSILRGLSSLPFCRERLSIRIWFVGGLIGGLGGLAGRDRSNGFGKVPLVVGGWDLKKFFSSFFF